MVTVKQLGKGWGGACGAGVFCLFWAGCASVERDGDAARPATPEAGSNSVAAAESAVTNAPPADGYEWDVLARMAAANGGEAKALLLEAQAARHQAAVDTGWRNPQLRVGRHWGDEDSETPAWGDEDSETPAWSDGPARAGDGNREWREKEFEGDTLGLRVYVANPFVNRWLRKRGAAEAQALEAASGEEAYAVFCEVRSLCLEAELLREEIGLLEQMADVRGKLRDARREQSEAGVTSPLDLIRAETRVASLASEIRERRTARQQLVRRIAVLSGLPAEQVKLRARSAAAPVDDARLAPDVLTDMAFARRPDLARAEREKEAAEYAVKAARAGQIPWLEYVEGAVEDEHMRTYGYEEDVEGRDRTTGAETEWQVRLAFTLPVFNWLGDEVRLTGAQLAAAQARAHGLYETVRAEVCGVLDDYRDAREELDRLAVESERFHAAMSGRIDALEQEATVKREEVLAAREELIVYRRVCLKAERECLRMAQYLETVSGGPLTPAR